MQGITADMTVREALPLLSPAEQISLQYCAAEFGIPLREFHLGHIRTYEMQCLQVEPRHFVDAKVSVLLRLLGSVVHCSLYKYTSTGTSFDETYERFRTDYCDKCPDRAPRPEDWHYTHESQQSENQANAEFISGPMSATYDRKPVGPAPSIPMPSKACAPCGLDFGEPPAWWCGFCQTWFCQRSECTKSHPEHPHPF